jgi:hypothetical protein
MQAPRTVFTGLFLAGRSSDAASINSSCQHRLDRPAARPLPLDRNLLSQRFQGPPDLQRGNPDLTDSISNSWPHECGTLRRGRF